MSQTTLSLYRQDRFPIFQNRMYDSMKEARDCPKGDIDLVEDLHTGLVRNAAFRPEVMNYDTHYQNEQALSPLFRSHLDSVADLIEATMGRKALVEVGCGKGFFLEMLLARGVDVTGFDPTYEGQNPKVRREYFSRDLGMRGEGLILRHVLEHIPSPVEFLHELAAANGHRGLIYIEVPCFDWICQNRTWFDIFYEHVNYFRFSDFQHIFDRVAHGARGFGGQYLTVVADLASLRQPRLDPQDRVAFPPDFTARLAAETTKPIGHSVVWGAASKGVIFALLRERAGQPIDLVIDINPAKQGRFLPGTGLQVVSPAQALATLAAGSIIYVMNSNYLQEIRAMTNNSFTYVGMSHD